VPPTRVQTLCLSVNADIRPEKPGHHLHQEESMVRLSNKIRLAFATAFFLGTGIWAVLASPAWACETCIRPEGCAAGPKQLCRTEQSCTTVGSNTRCTTLYYYYE